MLKKLLMASLAIGMVSGCVVRTRPAARTRTVVVVKDRCPPHHHYHHGRCYRD